MRVLILGGDGYLGWPTAMYLSQRGHDVLVVDNYFRRRACLESDCEPLVPAPNLPRRVTLKRSTGAAAAVKTNSQEQTSARFKMGAI